MVATIGEVRAARAALDEARRDLGIDPPLEVGVMVEVPAVAVEAERFARELDFLSIGTNDLAQYTMAAERGNEHVAASRPARSPRSCGSSTSPCGARRRTAAGSASAASWPATSTARAFWPVSGYQS